MDAINQSLRVFLVVALIGASANAKKPQMPTPSALDLYIQEAGQRAAVIHRLRQDRYGRPMRDSVI